MGDSINREVLAHGRGGDRGTPVQREVVGGPSLREVSGGVEGSEGGERGERGGEEEAHGDPVSQEGAGPPSWGGEALNKGEGGIGQSQAVVEVVGGVEGRRQPVAQPPHHASRAEHLVVEGDGCREGGGPLTAGPPVDEFGFWDREGDVELLGSSGYV